jgi:hypothetical protein
MSLIYVSRPNNSNATDVQDLLILSRRLLATAEFTKMKEARGRVILSDSTECVFNIYKSGFSMRWKYAENPVRGASALLNR